MEKMKKSLDEVIRERDSIHKDFKKIESMYFVLLCGFAQI